MKENLPPKTEMAANLVRTAKEVLVGFFKGEGVFESKCEKNRRLSICVDCQFCTDDMRCSLCGCNLNAKASLKTSVCPAKKW